MTLRVGASLDHHAPRPPTGRGLCLQDDLAGLDGRLTILFVAGQVVDGRQIPQPVALPGSSSPQPGPASPRTPSPRPQTPSPGPPTSGLVGSDPIVCQQQRVLDGVIVNAPNATAVLAGDGCDLRLSNCVLTGLLGFQGSGNSVVRMTNCRVEAQLWGVSLNATAQLHLEGGSVRGGIGSAAVAENSVIYVRGTRLEGRTSRSGAGRIEQAR